MTQRNTNLSETRMMRGMAITETSRIAENEDGSFAVPSQTGKDIVYQVKIIDNKLVCNCPDFTFRKVETCKHGYAVKFWIATNTYLNNKPKPKVFAEDSVQCDRCGSIKVICYGKNADKQIFYCKDCQHKFRESTLIKKSKYNAELVTLTLDLYFSGLSLRKIARNINDHFDLELDYSTIYKWIKKYIPIISEYVNSLTPQLSKTWHADELFVNMRGGKSTKGKTTIAFLWNVMDRKTRFLIASRLASTRESGDAIAVFKEAVQRSGNASPNTIYTDALKSYQAGISENFDKYVYHASKCGVNKPHPNNNRIERLNGTLRERVKVQRGWKTMKTPLAEGMRIQYNFVKPHMALDDKTPSEVCGIKIEGENKWKTLIENAMRDK